ncbi:MAG TPA: calcium/sodium antiporter [Gammaproteobacteria bacterium]|nr:calcium/sodium antiporter [Gammaproteobacteria bacterium]
MSNLLPLLAVICGLVLLAWSADRFVYGAAALARNLGVSPLIIGLTVVGFGTSAPELFVSAQAAMDGATGLALGNAVGSNIANTALVLGSAAMISPMTIRSTILRREYPVMLLVMLVVFALMWDLQLSRADGLLLFAGLLALIGWSVTLGLKERSSIDSLSTEYDQELSHEVKTTVAISWVILGLIVLLLSAHLLVWGAVKLALWFGLSDTTIGLTIVAIGTSLPEVATTTASARRGETDLAIGNIIGSNNFNMLGVIGLAGIIQPAQINPQLLFRDMTTMLALSLPLALVILMKRKATRITALHGLILVTCYVAYLVIVVTQAL